MTRDRATFGNEETEPIHLRSGRNAVWVAVLACAVVLAAFGPLIFGVPILGVYAAMDANFALQLVKGYAVSLEAHDWFPRWIAAGNAGFGSPVYYFYGRLPFCVAALLVAAFHISASAALMFGMGAFRLLAFFTCRAWLRRGSPAAAADLGALFFVAVPFAMTYNPLVRVGYAETAATALVPLLFLVLDREGRDLPAASRNAALLACVYAVLAATHLPQTLLAVGAATLYGFLVQGAYGAVVNLVGAACGFLLSAPNILPALAMQPLITPQAWTGSATGDVRSQFLFTLSRFHLYHLLGQEIYLYASWLLCFLPLLVWGVSQRFRGEPRTLRDRSLLVCLAVCLLAMTKLFWPLWVFVPQLRALQFPWRIFPATMAFGGGVTALLVARNRRLQTWAVAGICGIIAIQVVLPTAGAFTSSMQSTLAASLPKFVVFRLPHFVAWSQRESAAYATRRSFVPEYIPAGAREAGWHLDDDQSSLLSERANIASSLQALPPGLRLSRAPNGDILLRGRLGAPASLLLPSFYFPDEQVHGTNADALILDRGSGLTRFTLPGGSVDVRLGHDRTLRSVRESHWASIAGLLLLFGLLAFSFLGRQASPVPTRAERRYMS